MDLKKLLERLTEIEESCEQAKDEADSAESYARQSRSSADEASSYAVTAEEEAGYAESCSDDVKRSLTIMEGEICDLRTMLETFANEHIITAVCDVPEETTELKLPDTSTAVLNRDGTTTNKT